MQKLISDWMAILSPFPIFVDEIMPDGTKKSSAIYSTHWWVYALFFLSIFIVLAVGLYTAVDLYFRLSHGVLPDYWLVFRIGMVSILAGWVATTVQNGWIQRGQPNELIVLGLFSKNVFIHNGLYFYFSSTFTSRTALPGDKETTLTPKSGEDAVESLIRQTDDYGNLGSAEKQIIVFGYGFALMILRKPATLTQFFLEDYERGIDAGTERIKHEASILLQGVVDEVLTASSMDDVQNKRKKLNKRISKRVVKRLARQGVFIDPIKIVEVLDAVPEGGYFDVQQKTNRSIRESQAREMTATAQANADVVAAEQAKRAGIAEQESRLAILFATYPVLQAEDANAILRAYIEQRSVSVGIEIVRGNELQSLLQVAATKLEPTQFNDLVSAVVEPLRMHLEGGTVVNVGSEKGLAFAQTFPALAKAFEDILRAINENLPLNTSATTT